MPVSTITSTYARTILNDVPTPLSSNLPSITETNADFTANFVVTLDHDVQGGFDVAISNTNGTAGGADYTLNTTTLDWKSTRLNSSHLGMSYADFCVVKTNETFLVNVGE